MAIAFDVASNSGYQTAQSSYSWSHTVGTGLNSILVVGVSMLSVAGNQVSSITYNGAQLTFIRADTSVSTVIRSELWYLLNPKSGSNTVVVTLSTSTDSAAGVMSLFNVSQGNPIDNSSGGFGIDAGSGLATVSFPLYSAGIRVLDVIASSDTSIGNDTGAAKYNVTGTLGSGAGADEGGQGIVAAYEIDWSGLGLGASWTMSAVSLLPAGSKPGNTQKYIKVGNGLSRSEQAS